MSKLTDTFIDKIVRVMESKTHLPLHERAILFKRSDKHYYIFITLMKDSSAFGYMDFFVFGSYPIHSLKIQSMEALKIAIKSCLECGLRPHSLENGVETEIQFDGEEIRNN